MRFAFLDRDEERARLRRLLKRKDGCLAVLYGRRRCGKSRLLLEVLPSRGAVYYAGDDREGALQRASLATEIARELPAFDAVTYPDWDALFSRWYEHARPGAVLALDELPAMVASGRAIPSLLQKNLDRHRDKGVHLVLAGSSQRMMQGLVLDRSAPLYGRADEMFEISPLPAGWIRKALGVTDPVRAVEAFSVWGGVPRYWELAADYPDLEQAVEALALSPLGVLREEPSALLLDDLRETVQAASILSLVGQGCRRMSEVAGRIGKPATSLTRPVQRLLELGLLRRETPFGASPRDSKRTAYKIGDPFLRFWFRFVEPARSRIDSGRVRAVAAEIARAFPHHVAGVWEDLARASVVRLGCGDREWAETGRWWGTGLDGTPMEIDVVARSADGKALLLGEAAWSAEGDPNRLVAELRRKALNLPMAKGLEVVPALWLKDGPPRARGVRIFTPGQVMSALQ